MSKWSVGDVENVIIFPFTGSAGFKVDIPDHAKFLELFN